MGEHTFVLSREDCRRGNAAIDTQQEAAIPAPGALLRPTERGAAVLDGHGARGWSCPDCAVENFHTASDAEDLVECDYCGGAFAMLG
jgi:hypothetical protein